MQKITPFLWFDDNAEAAVNVYTSIFRDGKIGRLTHYSKAAAEASGRPEGTLMTASFSLMGREFAAINGGPHFKINPAISFFVTLESEAEIDTLWAELAKDGTALMPLQKYDWSEKYGWIQDRFGVSWQISLGNLKDAGHPIIPAMLFVGKQHGRAETAIRHYTSVFPDSGTDILIQYSADELLPEGTVKFSRFNLSGEHFIAMDGGEAHNFTFNEAVSFVVNCGAQDEVDYFWEKLTEGGDEAARQCGWLKDKFGVSWQVIPEVLFKLLDDPDPAKSGSVMQALLKMKKIDISGLKNAYGQ